jgi:hypothetical protein
MALIMTRGKSSQAYEFEDSLDFPPRVKVESDPALNVMQLILFTSGRYDGGQDVSIRQTLVGTGKSEDGRGLNGVVFIAYKERSQRIQIAGLPEHPVSVEKITPDYIISKILESHRWVLTKIEAEAHEHDRLPRKIGHLEMI